MSWPITINDFSPHLFWDVNRNELDFYRTKEQIIFQVVELGLMKDWELLQKVYPKETLKEVVQNLRSLDKVTLYFLAHYLKIDKTQFRC